MTDFIEVPKGEVPTKKKFQVPKEGRKQTEAVRLRLFFGTWNFSLGTSRRRHLELFYLELPSAGTWNFSRGTH
jgi:hypothetical protein